MPIKSVKIKISKKTFFLMYQGSLNQKIWFLDQKVCSVSRQTDRQRDIHEVNTEDTLSGFQDFFLQPIIKDRSNNLSSKIGPKTSHGNIVHSGRRSINPITRHQTLVYWERKRTIKGINWNKDINPSWSITSLFSSIRVIPSWSPHCLFVSVVEELRLALYNSVRKILTTAHGHYWADPWW